MSGVIISGKETAKALNDLARHQMIVKLLADIRADLMICDIEGWDKKEYLDQIKSMLNQIGE